MAPRGEKEAIICPKEEILRRLQRETTCSSCCSALRVMIQRPLHQLSLLETFVSHEDVQGYVLKENLASPKSLEDACAKFPLHEWLKNCQPLKRDKRCPMHANSRHIFNSADLWEDMWAEMSETQKQEICAVNAEELHDKLWQHCTDKHHLCKDCRNNVMWAYDKLTKKCARPPLTPCSAPLPPSGAAWALPLSARGTALTRPPHPRPCREGTPVGTEAEQELASLQAYFDVDESKEGCICVHTTALPTILYHYEDTLAEESENNTKGRHAPTRQAGLSEMLCVVGRLLLRKVLTSYQSSLEEEQNQQLLVRLVLSHFQAQALERQALTNMASLLEASRRAPLAPLRAAPPRPAKCPMPAPHASAASARAEPRGVLSAAGGHGGAKGRREQAEAEEGPACEAPGARGRGAVVRGHMGRGPGEALARGARRGGVEGVRPSPMRGSRGRVGMGAARRCIRLRRAARVAGAAAAQANGLERLRGGAVLCDGQQ